MTAPIISVLVPAYNRAKTIAQCLRSAMAGGEQAIEIIVADNGSTDATVAIVESLMQEDPRISLIRHPANLGPLPNWRSCLEMAKGTYVHWLWSDDWIEPDFYRVMLDGMARQQCDVGLCAARITDPVAGWHHVKYSLPSIDHGRDRLLKQGLEAFFLPLSPAAALLPRDSVQRHFHDNIPVTRRIDCNRKAMGADVLMILGAILDRGRVYFHPDALVNFRYDDDSITVSHAASMRNAHYAWARAWWARRHQLPRSWSVFDYMRLAHDRHFLSCGWGILRGRI